MNNPESTNKSAESSSASVTEQSAKIVHQPKSKSREDDELVAVYESVVLSDGDKGFTETVGFSPPPVPPTTKQWQEQLLTPWGIGALLVFLFANTLLSWSQWLQPSNETVPQSINTVPAPSIPESYGKPKQNLSLNSLSTVTPPSTKVNSPPKIAPLGESKLAPVSAKPATNLTNALLPPSLQPALIQVAPVPSLPSNSLSQSILPVNQLVSQTQPLPAPTSVKPVPVPSAVPPSNADSTESLLIQERIKEEIYLRQQQQVPLGFNHQTRVKIQSAHNQQDPTPLIQQLQKLQQQRIDQMNAPTPQQ